jgi:hormone-sensitive lipase
LIIINLLAVRVDEQYFSPSFVLCLKDLILPYHLLRFILEAYRGDLKENEFDNMFLSPILAPNSLLKNLPPVRMIVGSADPLRDDNFRYLKKLM